MIKINQFNKTIKINFLMIIHKEMNNNKVIITNNLNQIKDKLFK